MSTDRPNLATNAWDAMTTLYSTLSRATSRDFRPHQSPRATGTLLHTSASTKNSANDAKVMHV